MTKNRPVLAQNNPNLAPPTEETVFVKAVAEFQKGKVIGFTPVVYSSKRGVLYGAIREVSGINMVNPPTWDSPEEAMHAYDQIDAVDVSQNRHNLVKLARKVA